MEDSASNKESEEYNQLELINVANRNIVTDPAPEPAQITENATGTKKESAEKKEKRITRLLTFWKKKEKTKDPISVENGEESKNSTETGRKKAFSPSEMRRRAGSILKMFKPRSKSSLPKKAKIEHGSTVNNAPKISHDDGDLPRYRSYEQFERATVFQKSMSVQAIELSDELLQAKQEYLQHYNGSNNTNAPSQRSASYIDGSNSILSEKKRGRGDSIRKEDLAKLQIPGPFFGVDVDSMYKFPGQKIPAFLALLITHIIKHGPRVRDLFATNKISLAQVQKLKNEFENASQQDIIHRKEILMSAGIHTVVGLLLTWLNNLPSPLATIALCEKLRFPIAVNHGQFSHSLIQSTLYNSLQPTQRRSFLYLITFLKQMIKLHDEQLHVKSPRPSDAYSLSEPRHSMSVSEGPLSVEFLLRDQSSSENTKTDSDITPRDVPPTNEPVLVEVETTTNNIYREKTPSENEVGEVLGESGEKTAEQPEHVDIQQNEVSEDNINQPKENPETSDEPAENHVEEKSEVHQDHEEQSERKSEVQEADTTAERTLVENKIDSEQVQETLASNPDDKEQKVDEGDKKEIGHSEGLVTNTHEETLAVETDERKEKEETREVVSEGDSKETQEVIHKSETLEDVNKSETLEDVNKNETLAVSEDDRDEDTPKNVNNEEALAVKKEAKEGSQVVQEEQPKPSEPTIELQKIQPQEETLTETADKPNIDDNSEISRSEQESESMVYFPTSDSIEESEERITMEKEFDNFLADFESKYEELFRKSFTTEDYSGLLQEVETKLEASFDAQIEDSFDLVEISKLFSESMFQISNGHAAETSNAMSNLEDTLSALQKTVNNSDVEVQEIKRESLMQSYQEKTVEHLNMQQLRLGVMHYFLTEDILAEKSGAVYLKSEKSTERFLAEAPKKVLIYKLLDHEYQSADPIYVDAFLLTYRYALPSAQLLAELIELYPKDNYMELSQQTFDLRIRVCTVIRKWIEGYFYEMGEEHDFIKVLKSFLKTHSSNITTEEQEFFRYFLTSIDTWQELVSIGHLRNVYNFPDFSTHKVSPTAVNRVTEVDPKVLAATLTLMDHQLFCNITMQEFLSNNNPITSLNSKQVVLFTRQFTALVQRTDKVCDWILKEIFDASDSKEKAATIKHFIKVAQECLQLKNYNGCYSISAALNNNDVQNNIAKLHDRIGSHNIIALNSILDIFNPKDLFAAYQNVVNSSDTPCVPWIGLYQKYLSHLEETEPTFKSRANRIVNFNKMRKIYQLLQHIKRYQDSLYNYQLDVAILYYLLSVFNRPKFRAHVARQEQEDKDKDSNKKKKKK